MWDSGHLDRYLPPLEPNNSQLLDAQFQLKKRWPIQFCCVERGLSQKFLILAGSAMALVPLKLLENQTKEWKKFIVVNNTLLNFKFLIGHSQAKSNDALINNVENGLAVASNSIPA